MQRFREFFPFEKFSCMNKEKNLHQLVRDLERCSLQSIEKKG